MQQTSEQLNWIKTVDQMPTVGQKVMVFLWMDSTVSQAWWNGEYFILAAANAEGTVIIYQVLPVAISHWQDMPDIPVVSKSPEKKQSQQPQLKIVH